MAKLFPFLLVGLGGAAGSVLRYTLSLVLQRWSVAIPFGTLTANLIGCFLVGLVAESTTQAGHLSPETRLFLATGFCGGLTTMSSFMYESGRFAQESEWWLGFLYFGGTLLGCMAAYALAVAAVRLVLPH